MAESSLPADAPAAPPALDPAALQAILGSVLADWVKALDLRVLEARVGEVELALPVTPLQVHGGGVLSGQTLMAAADSAMILAVSSQLGGFRPMTTVQLQTSFLRPVAGDSGTVRLVARVLRAGKSLVFGEVEAFDAAGRLAAHSTTTYALL
jgi:uncharacterized protein (TIGR00369 family)